MVQTAFLLEKIVLELGKAAKLAFGREVCRAKLHSSSAAYVGPSGPWTLQRVHTQTPLYKPRSFKTRFFWSFQRVQTVFLLEKMLLELG